MLGALILTGGRSSRMGADKAEVVWRGRRAVDWAHRLAASFGPGHIVTVGGAGYGYDSIADPAPFAGPVGGVLVGARALGGRGVTRLLVLAVDAPTMTRADLEPLFGPPEGAAYEDLHLPFVAPLAALSRQARADWPLAGLIARSGLARLPAPPWARDRLRGANTPAERERLLLG